jgi:plasmid stabilization system protein ParE
VTLRVIFHDRAEEELNEAADYYARARPGLGEAFLAEVHHAVEALLAAPLAGARSRTRSGGPSTGADAGEPLASHRAES